MEKDISAQYNSVQSTTVFEIYENFCADLSSNYEEAMALVRWYAFYAEAAQNLRELPPDIIADFDIATVDDLLWDPACPEIDDLIADIEAQLLNYARENN